jgi:protein phosphatase 2C family protein 2/3
VSVIFNVSKPQSFEETIDNPWPKCSFFGLYDGHGGAGCADFLRDNLHKYVSYINLDHKRFSFS